LNIEKSSAISMRKKQLEYYQIIAGAARSKNDSTAEQGPSLTILISAHWSMALSGGTRTFKPK
jgi:hypothetical protein